MAALTAASCRLGAIMPHGSIGSKARRYAVTRRPRAPIMHFP